MRILNLLLCTAAICSAQDVVPATPPDTAAPASLWKNQVVASANFASSYFHDWSQGGEDNLAWNFKIDAKAERDGADWNWANAGKVELGQIKQGDFAPRKSADEFKLETILTRKLTTMLNPFGSASAKSQFAFGYKYPKDGGGREAVSDWLDPAYFTQTLGLGYKPVPFFRTRLGAAVQETWTNGFRQYSDDTTTAGQERWKVEPGAEWVTTYDQTLFESLVLKSELGVFANFKGMDEVDAAWTSSVAWQFTRWVNLNLAGEARRDLNQFDGWQWKHVLSLGLTANLI